MRPEIVVANRKGKIQNLPHLEGAGMKGGYFFRLSPSDLVKLPYGSELFMLPDRVPVGFDPKNSEFTALDDLYAVAAFVSPGFTIGYNSAYVELNKPKMLPLFSYGAVVFYKNEFYVAAIRVDRERRQDLRLMNIDSVRKNVRKLRKLFPGNRLMRHLEGCALTYGCPAAKNLFLSRYEAPLPASPYCNARCIGCISYQPRDGCSVTQPRIRFLPTPYEIAETALYHIENVKDPVVSFGQGCEGEPLLISKTIREAIALVRRKTGMGMINMNTNASSPEDIGRLFDAGLDSIRVSLNSAREEYYTRYYKPKGYTFKDVIKSIKTAKKKGFVSINYLAIPGFTDTRDEFTALEDFIKDKKVDMIQWRNLNFDPIRYYKEMRFPKNTLSLLSMREIIDLLKRDFPDLMMGYFNPSRGRIKRFRRN
jgi:MoaA/NifB/PqqE/SkfB family radical SAM enzyme